MFQRALTNEFSKRGLDRSPIAMVTQVLVDPDDSAFADPAKPIGPQLDEETAKQRAAEEGWTVKDDIGRGWRRVVASPLPQEIVELSQLKTQVEAGSIVIACGGGIPVVKNEKGYLVGIEAVVDKDLASAMLASGVGADLFIVSTGVDRVAINYGMDDEEWLDHMTVAEAKAHMADGQFDPGSMRPKIQAMINYLENGGKKGLNIAPENLVEAFEGKSGTVFAV